MAKDNRKLETLDEKEQAAFELIAATPKLRAAAKVLKAGIVRRCEKEMEVTKKMMGVVEFICEYDR